MTDVPAIEINGVDMPVIGFSSYKQLVYSKHGVNVQGLFEHAAASGYRHFDTAQIYETEGDIGNALAATGLPRDELFISSKVRTENYNNGDFRRSVEASLMRLKVESVDLLLLHWPKPMPGIKETIAALNEVHAAGLTKIIGVCNFPTQQLKEAVLSSSAAISVEQIEYHPYFKQDRVISEVRRLGGVVTAWSPLAQGHVNEHPVLREIGSRYGKSAAQAALRWLIQQDRVTAIPRAMQPHHVVENIDIFDFALTDAEMSQITGLGSPQNRIGDWLDRAFDWDAA